MSTFFDELDTSKKTMATFVTLDCGLHSRQSFSHKTKPYLRAGNKLANEGEQFGWREQDDMTPSSRPFGKFNPPALVWTSGPNAPDSGTGAKGDIFYPSVYWKPRRMAPLLSRLRKDLRELQESPYPGVEVFIDDANVHRFCLVLTPPSGPWKDLRLHFDVELPSNWPAAPPAIRNSIHGIRHPNLFGSYICCDLLKLNVYGEHGYDGGYTPALTLRGLFLQFLTFFSSTRVEQEYGGYIEIGDYTTEVFLSDSHVSGVLLGQSSHDRNPGSAMQTELCRKWNSHPSPATILASYSPGSHETRHLVKVAIAEHPRLHLVQQRNPLWLQTLQLIREWSCSACPYGSTTLPHRRGEDDSLAVVDGNSKINDPLMNPLSSLRPLDSLPDDVLLELAATLPTESVISTCKAYPRFRELVDATHVLLQRELVCFFLKVPVRDCVLGIGISLDTGTRTLSSDYDWLSEEAYKVHGVRTSIRKSRFNYFLPLAFSQSHFERVHDKIWNWLRVIDDATWKAEQAVIRRSKHFNPDDPRGQPPPNVQGTVRVIFKLMNTAVVGLMKSCDDAFAGGERVKLVLASERAVYSYVILFHLLICLCRKNRSVHSDVVKEVRRFLANPSARRKRRVPDLGEFIVQVTLALALPNPPIAWEELCGCILEEATTRSVRWVLKEAPELEVMEINASNYRLERTFALSKTSLRLMMFQVTFLNLFVETYAGKLDRLDNNYGFAEQAIAARMVEEAKAIYKVRTWPAFFQKVKFVKGYNLSALAFSMMLREAVQQSAQNGYHRSSPPEVLAKLKAQRQRMGK